MKRKVCLHGPSTLTVSLPASWVKRHGIKKGDELELTEENGSLRVAIDKPGEELKKEIDIGGNERTGRSYITAYYRLGYSELTLKYDNQEYINEVQRMLTEQLLGFEIIKQDEKSCTVKDISGMSEREFDNVMRRSWLLFISLAEDTLKAIENKDFETLKNIKYRDRAINRFTNYCSRTVITHGYKEHKKNPIIYHFVRNLEELADEYQDLAMYLAVNKISSNGDSLGMMKKLTEKVKEIYQLFYTYDEDKTEQLFHELKKIILDSQNEFASKGQEPGMIHFIHQVAYRARNLLSTIIEKHI